MLSRFFHVRSTLKPFTAPTVEPRPDDVTVPASPAPPHADYDRQPLATSGFDHYVEWNEDDERFFVH
jgi:hypothetical protein